MTMSSHERFTVRHGLALALLSAATIALEITLTRLFAVAQFYHFAFMVVSLALLGFGLSGTVLSLAPWLGDRPPARLLAASGLGFALTTLAAYTVTNLVPFDSFTIAWDRRQVAVLALHIVLLSLPFAAGGFAVAALLTRIPHRASAIYGVNFAGSALGSLLALALPAYLGGEGMVLVCAGLAALATVIVDPGPHPSPLAERHTAADGRPPHLGEGRGSQGERGKDKETDPFPFAATRRPRVTTVAAMLLLVSLGALWLLSPSWLALRLSPYKGLSQALRYPGARVVWTAWNAYARVDVVESAGIRSLPGLSYHYTGPLPRQRGLFVDGDNMNPIVLEEDGEYARALPLAAAFVVLRANAALTPHPSDANTTHKASRLPLSPLPNVREGRGGQGEGGKGPDLLILDPRAGLDVAVARALGARTITVAEANALALRAAAAVYTKPGVHVIRATGRSFLRRTDHTFDLIVLSLVDAYHPVRSGAYSLAEDYRYTVEAFTEAIQHLTPDGLFVVTRWLQTPPSEFTRALALAATAVEAAGGNPAQQMVAFRGYNTGTVIVKKTPFREAEVANLRAFLDARAFDLVWAPGMREEDANRHNILPEPTYYRIARALVTTADRDAFYDAYPFDVRPPTDDHPFFGHYFRWRQAREVWAELGKTWQPFGGAGYFVILLLILITALLAVLLILLPVLLGHRSVLRHAPIPRRYPLLYFANLGLAYLFVEIPLIQRFILYLDHPTYAFAVVLFALLLFSGVGSMFWGKGPPARAVWAPAALALLTGLALPVLSTHTLGWSLPARIISSILLLAPLGTLMGLPFPRGLGLLEQQARGWTPWAWAVNGALSVVASPLAALIALTYGFRTVFLIGAAAYALAWLTARAWEARASAPSPPPAP